MATITGNLQAISKDVDNAQKKADKLKEKGGKAAAGKVATAASDVENAQGQWDSQAPYVFERLQAVDEARIDHLRNVLTQYQTHVIESSSTISTSAEECLNALLNVQTADEIKTFALKATRTLPASTAAKRRMSRADIQSPGLSATDPGSSLSPTTSLAVPVPPLPRPDDGSSQRSSSCKIGRMLRSEINLLTNSSSGETFQKWVWGSEETGHSHWAETSKCAPLRRTRRFPRGQKVVFEFGFCVWAIRAERVPSKSRLAVAACNWSKTVIWSFTGPSNF
jgi:hypothetical protein